MILALGSTSDRVFPDLLAALAARGCPFAVVDEDEPGRYRVTHQEDDGHGVYRIEGGDCRGTRPAGAVFVRHAVARTLDPLHLQRLAVLQAGLNRMLMTTPCPVVNRPTNAYSNYSKPYQVGLLAEAGFDVPDSLVTNDPATACAFCERFSGRVIMKGVSNMMTLAQVMTPALAKRLDLLPSCPTLFQEYIEGVDYRVHVVGAQTFVTRLVARNEDYRRSLLVEGDPDVIVEASILPAETLQRCVRFTGDLGLVVSGIDFKETDDGRLVALELNPYPQVTFYQGRSGQPIVGAIVDYLLRHDDGGGDILV